jgi:membrane-bound lytic murein transglycosylase D
MVKRTLILFFLLTIASLEGFYILKTGSLKQPDKVYVKSFVERNKTFTVPIPDKIEFAGENVPLNQINVREGLDRELTIGTYAQSTTLSLLKRANRFLPTIVPILKKYGIPEDFKYVAVIESSLTNVVSPAGAAGFWQIIPETAKRFGLQVSDDVDERYYLEKATEAACKLLKHSFDLYGNWSLAAAAYNAGEGKISKELERQKVNNYFDLNLSDETTRYLHRILAFKLIYENPTFYGYYLRKRDLYQPIPTYTVKVDTTINDMITFAQGQGINYRLLKEFNPWIRKDKLTNPSGVTYSIKLPKKEYLDYNRLLQELTDPEMIFNDTTHRIVN